MSISEGSLGVFRPIIGSSYESLKNPEKSQRQVLTKLTESFRKTEYGAIHSASEILHVADYRRNFPIMDYGSLHPHLGEVRNGDYNAFLSEPLLCWVMRRGSTGPARAREH